MWESFTIERILSELKTREQGLSSSEAEKRLKTYGSNTLKEQDKLTWVKILLSQFKSPLVILLIIATAIALFIGHFVDTIIIGVIILVNAGFGFLQEFKAEKAMLALKKLVSPTAIVFRDGKKVQILTAELVPGDIIYLDSGDKIPADAKLLDATSLKVDEASLTGESVPVLKSVSDAIYSGTAVVYGHAIAIVVKTGMETKIGSIAEAVSKTEDKTTPLMKKLAHFSKFIGVGVLVIAGIIFGLGLWRGTAVFDMLINSIALAVAAVPEGLPAVVTVTLAIGIKTMAAKKAIVRKLSVAETLGSATVICTDKTGTLTKNEMTVQKIYADSKLIEVTGSGYDLAGKFTLNGKSFIPNKNKIFSKLLEIGKLCNLASLTKNGILGDPTEGALLVIASKAGINANYKKIDELPFDSGRKMMTTVHQEGKLMFAYTKGAPEVLLKKCKFIYENNKVRVLTKKDMESIEKAEHGMTSSALRVLGFAFRYLKGDKRFIARNVEKDLVFVGLTGMIDPPRQEVPTAIGKCRDAGIRVIMITGDNKDTAIAVAKQVGLYSGGEVVLGEAVDKLSESQLGKLLETAEIFARVSPEHKSRIVAALQKNGEIVAVTGDGVNDAPALKSADIGVAMGIKGTEVSKEASDIILKDDNFATIVTAIEEGRNIYDNIKKFIRYLLSCNLGEVLLIFLASLMSLPLPLIAVQILLMNLLTDGLPALALGVDSPDKSIMRRPPRSPKERVIDKRMMLNVLLVGAIIGAGALTLFARGSGLVEARTLAFSGIIMFQIFNVFNAREEVKSIFSSCKPNRWLLLAILSSLAIMLVILYTPLASLFGVTSLSLKKLGMTVLVASSVIVIVELEKLTLRKVFKSF